MGKKPLRILSIDDNLSCQLVAARFFTLVGGHIVEVAENVSEGFKKAAELRPDIILLDMSMPDMNGFEVLDSLYADTATRDIPVIMITEGSLNDTELDNLKAKANFMLFEQKPANFERLLGRIEAAVQPGILRLERR